MRGGGILKNQTLDELLNLLVELQPYKCKIKIRKLYISQNPQDSLQILTMGPQTASSAASSLLSCASSLAHAFFHLRMKVIILDKLLSLSYSPILDAVCIACLPVLLCCAIRFFIFSHQVVLGRFLRRWQRCRVWIVGAGMDVYLEEIIRFETSSCDFEDNCDSTSADSCG